MRGRLLRAVFTLVAVAAACLQAAPAEKPGESEHRKGPNGLEGWVLKGMGSDDPNQELPFALVIARNGKVIRQIQGQPLMWHWIFLPDGKRVAFEAGPLHSALFCVLADIKTGHELDSFDCTQGLPDKAPDWLKMLEGSH